MQEHQACFTWFFASLFGRKGSRGSGTQGFKDWFPKMGKIFCVALTFSEWY